MSVLWCDGDITLRAGNGARPNHWECSVAFTVRDEFQPEFVPASDLDPTLIAGAIGAGMLSLVPIWAALLALRFLLKAVK